MRSRRARRTTEALGAAWAVDALACARLTRLVVGDVITQPARERLIAALYRRHGDDGDTPATGWTDYVHSDPDAPKLATLLTCPWCVSVYLAFAISVARSRLGWGWDVVARSLAASEVAGLIAGHEEG